MRTRVNCNVAQGDQPVRIQFFKDEKPIEGKNRDDGIIIQEVDSFSLSLAIANLSSSHNGNYRYKLTTFTFNFIIYLLFYRPFRHLEYIVCRLIIDRI